MAFPETEFKDRMFVNWGNDVYPDYPERAMGYILRRRPPILTRQTLYLPGYVPRWRGELYGVEYRFYSPID